MSLHRIQKKLVLLKYSKNSLWKTYSLKSPNTAFETLVDNLFGQNAYRNISRWISDDNPRPNISKKHWSKLISQESGKSPRLDIFDENVSSIEFGKFIGLSRYASKYLIDSVYAEKHNLFDSIVYSKDDVESFIDQIAGTYKLYLFSPEKTNYSPAAISIRYYLPLTSNVSRNKGYRVRCRASILAKYEHELGGNTHVEYDGYLSYENRTISFSFESRLFHGERRKMFLSFENDLTKTEQGSYFFGGYLKSRSIVGTRNNFGPAALEPVFYVGNSIKIESDLTEFGDEHSGESNISSILRDEHDITFSKDFFLRHGWVI